LWKEKSEKGNFLVKMAKIIFYLGLTCIFIESMIIMAEPLLAFVVFGILFVLISYYLLYVEFLKEH